MPPPTAVQPTRPAPTHFRADIQGLRAVAVVAVVAFHAHVPGFSGGFVGVDVFFVISGFLITGLILRDFDRPSGFRFGAFYARRIRRLLPLATLVIVATLAASVLFQSPLRQEGARGDARSAALFYSNMRFAQASTDYFQQGAPPSPFQHFWSLSVEEQFYLFWPALLLVAAGRRQRHRGRARLGLVVGLVLIVSLALSLYLTSASQPWAFFSLPSRAWELAVGAALAVGSRRLLRVPKAAGLVLGWFGLGLIVVATTRFDETTRFPGVAALVPVLGAAMVIVAGTHGRQAVGPDRSVGRLLALKPMQAGGRYSYSLYLWHWPVLVLAAAKFGTIATRWERALVVVSVAVVPLAIASTHLLEDPLRQLRRLQDAIRLTLALGAALVVTSVAVIPVYGSLIVKGPLTAGIPAAAVSGEDLVPTDYVPSNVTPTLRNAGVKTNAPLPGGCVRFHECIYGDPNAEVEIVVFGDSHASHWGAAYDEIAKATGWKIRQIATGACASFLFAPIGRPNVDCSAWRKKAFASIRAERPQLIVLSNYSGPAFQDDPRDWARGVNAALDQLPRDSRVAVLSETPEAGKDIPSCLAVNLTQTARCEPSRSSPTLDPLNSELRSIVEGRGAEFVDAASWMCSAVRCPVVTGNVLIYRDRHHVSQQFALSRADRLQAAFAAALGDEG